MCWPAETGLSIVPNTFTKIWENVGSRIFGEREIREGLRLKAYARLSSSDLGAELQPRDPPQTVPRQLAHAPPLTGLCHPVPETAALEDGLFPSSGKKWLILLKCDRMVKATSPPLSLLRLCLCRALLHRSAQRHQKQKSKKKKNYATLSSRCSV